VDTPARRVQTEGFRDVRAALSTDRPAREIAADVVLAEIARGQGGVHESQAEATLPGQARYGAVSNSRRVE
jgi:hypothetical protein